MRLSGAPLAFNWMYWESFEACRKALENPAYVMPPQYIFASLSLSPWKTLRLAGELMPTSPVPKKQSRISRADPVLGGDCKICAGHHGSSVPYALLVSEECLAHTIAPGSLGAGPSSLLRFLLSAFEPPATSGWEAGSSLRNGLAASPSSGSISHGLKRMYSPFTPPSTRTSMLLYKEESITVAAGSKCAHPPTYAASPFTALPVAPMTLTCLSILSSQLTRRTLLKASHVIMKSGRWRPGKKKIGSWLFHTLETASFGRTVARRRYLPSVANLG
mmetsp:Transcript_13709/g.49874  ORF Transcript_13709/g.49874 Transcript_13709/m.49874 type:complete len:275 (-) Transcript_13709:761-1585(-)